MTAQQVVQKYVPREVLKPFHSRHQRWALIVAHRRFGKTVGVLNDMVGRALRTPKKNAFYAYLAPYYGQAKQASWMYLKQSVATIPGVKIRESDLVIELPNGSRIRVFGADNPDSLRGLYFDGIVLDEFGDMAGRVWTEVIRPALADRKGWAVFIGTPRGKNKFFEMREKAKKSPDWFYLEIKASTSGILSAEELASLTADMDEDEIAQEFECSFEASLKGSYYGKHILHLEARGQLIETSQANPLYDPSEPVSCSHDPGHDDAWAIWFWQVIGGEVRFIDYWCETGFDAEEVIDVLDLKPYAYETWWVPHDALHKTARSKKSILDVFRDADAPARKVPNPDEGNKVLHGVNAVRKTLRTYPIVFDAIKCARGLESLRNYSRKWNPDAKVFSQNPKHDEWSHGADSFRYACLAINPETIQRSVERANRKRSRSGTPSINKPTTGDDYTLNDAWEAHQQQVAQQRLGERERI